MPRMSPAFARPVVLIARCLKNKTIATTPNIVPTKGTAKNKNAIIPTNRLATPVPVYGLSFLAMSSPRTLVRSSNLYVFSGILPLCLCFFEQCLVYLFRIRNCVLIEFDVEHSLVEDGLCPLLDLRFFTLI